MQDGIDRRQDDQGRFAAGETRQSRQRRQPLGENAAMGGDAVVGLAVPGRELHHRQIGREELERPRELLHTRSVAAYHRKTDGRDLPSGLGLDRTREIGDHKSFRSLGNIREGQRMAGRQQLRRRSDNRHHASRPG